MKLSIIIPYYNAEPYTSELLDVLEPQISEDVEVIVVDDGSPKPFKTSYKWCRVIRKKNGGCATARNRGLDEAQGEYISFVDADDIVANTFVKEILNKISVKQFDVCDLSWKSLTTDGMQHNHRLSSDNDYLPNPSVCTRIFRKDFIGNVRFNEQKDSTEDEDFSRKIGYLRLEKSIVHVSITNYMYFYRTAVENSKIKRYKQGLMHTKRVTYYFNHVTKDMTWLIDEIREEDKLNEVWLLTNQCDIPELKRYCQISGPIPMWTHYLRGEPYHNCTVVPIAQKVDVVMYCEFANMVGGISTFIYNWCELFKDKYNILVLYDQFADIQINRLRRIVKCQKNNPSRVIQCNTIILNRLTDKIPGNIRAKRSVQVCHACSQIKYRIPTNRDYLVNVSQAAKDSWGEESKHGIVIHNPIFTKTKKALFLVSATRIGACDKGSNDSRYIKLANKLNEAGISFIWLNFSDKPLSNPPANFINMSARLNVQDYIARADYLVQLSDIEAYSYSILEALTNNTALIITPIPSAFEQGVKDGVNAHVVPYNMEFDVRKLLEVPEFEFQYDNGLIEKEWRKLLGKPEDFDVYIPPKFVNVVVTCTYYDIVLGQNLQSGAQLSMPEDRAKYLQDDHPHHVVKIIGG